MHATDRTLTFHLSPWGRNFIASEFALADSRTKVFAVFHVLFHISFLSAVSTCIRAAIFGFAVFCFVVGACWSPSELPAAVVSCFPALCVSLSVVKLSNGSVYPESLCGVPIPNGDSVFGSLQLSIALAKPNLLS